MSSEPLHVAPALEMTGGSRRPLGWGRIFKANAPSGQAIFEEGENGAHKKEGESRTRQRNMEWQRREDQDAEHGWKLCAARLLLKVGENRWRLQCATAVVSRFVRGR